MTQLYDNPVRPKEISAFSYANFIDKYSERSGADLAHLRFGQAFIVHFSKILSITDPELFYSVDNLKSHKIINDFYIID